MKTANSETVASAICGLILLLLGAAGTVVAMLSLIPGVRPYLHVCEFRVDYMIIGPMVIIIGSGILSEIFKRGGSSSGRKGTPKVKRVFR